MGVDITLSDNQNNVEAIQALFDLPLDDQTIAFLYIGYAGIILRLPGKTMAFDLGKSLSQEGALAIPNLDLLFFTHTHWDHYHAPNASRIHKSTSAHIIAEPKVAEDLTKQIPTQDLISANPNSQITVNNANVTSFVGVHPRPITLFHVAYLNIRIFHAGDSGYVPMVGHPTDVAFLPTGAPSPSCTPESALKFTIDLAPKVVVPFHGREHQLTQFKELVEDTLPSIRVIIPEPYELIQLSL